MEQHDAFGVIPLGGLTSDDIEDMAVQMVAKDAYIGRLQKRILELTPKDAPAQASVPLENGDAAVIEATEIVKTGKK